MIETDKITTRRCIINQQLFSEAYLRELRTGKFPREAVEVCLQIIREWREAYPDLEDGNQLRQYVGQCLSALHISYTPQQNLYILYTDKTRTNRTSICLIVNDVDLGWCRRGIKLSLVELSCPSVRRLVLRKNKVAGSPNKVVDYRQGCTHVQ